MWDFFETVRHRHSVRKYQSDMPVEPEKLHAILEMACAAPSAGDIQAYRIFVIQDQAKKEALKKLSNNQEFIGEAPACLVFCADRNRSGQKFGERGKTLYAVQDATIAATYAQLAIVAAGMGSTWVGNFDSAALSNLLELGEGVEPVAMLSLGYPAELPEPSTRRHLEEITSYL
jgi:nitroreductase